MTTQVEQFNIRWADFKEPGHYGLAINNPKVIAYLDQEFAKETNANPDFTYAQIKLKFGSARVYTNSDKDSEWEEAIDNILKQNNE